VPSLYVTGGHHRRSTNQRRVPRNPSIVDQERDIAARICCRRNVVIVRNVQPHRHYADAGDPRRITRSRIDLKSAGRTVNSTSSDIAFGPGWFDASKTTH
jgi:hypothetical protein